MISPQPSPRHSWAPAPCCRAGGTAFVSVKETDKPVVLPAVRGLIELGFHVVATDGTAAYLAAQGWRLSASTRWRRAARTSSIGSRMVASSWCSTLRRAGSRSQDSKSIRASAMLARIPYFTTAAAGSRRCARSARLASARLKCERSNPIMLDR